MSNAIRSRNGSPFNFIGGLLVDGLPVGGAVTSQSIVTALGYTPTANTAAAIKTALGYTPVRQTDAAWSLKNGVQQEIMFGYSNTNKGLFVQVDDLGVGSIPLSTTDAGTYNTPGVFTYNGTITATGDIAAFSDENLKTDWENLPNGFIEALAKVRIGTYTRIDTGERQAGASAQSLQKVLKEFVKDGEYLSVVYGNAALVSAVKLAEEVVSMKETIAAQNAAIELLTVQLNSLSAIVNSK